MQFLAATTGLSCFCAALCLFLAIAGFLRLAPRLFLLFGQTALFRLFGQCFFCRFGFLEQAFLVRFCLRRSLRLSSPSDLFFVDERFYVKANKLPAQPKLTTRTGFIAAPETIVKKQLNNPTLLNAS